MIDSILNSWPWFIAGWVMTTLWIKGTSSVKDLIRQHDAATLKVVLDIEDRTRHLIHREREWVHDALHHATAMVLRRIDDALPIAEEIP